MKKLLLILICSLQLNNIDAQSWSPLGTGMSNIISIFTPSVRAICVYNGELYAGGYFDNADGNLVNNIAKWNGTNWLSVGSGVNGSVSSLTLYNGELYVSGNFFSAGGVPVSQIAKWNGTNWSDVGMGIRGAGTTIINSLAVYNGDLYAAGSFDSAGNVSTHNIAKWDGSNWSSAGNWNGNFFTVLTVFNNELYAAGQIFVSKWNDTTWTNINIGFNHPALDVVISLTGFNNELYVGGKFDSIGIIRANNIAKWGGINWLSLSTGTDHISQQDGVYSLASYNNQMYMSGYFSSAGGNSASNIAKWDGSNWSSVGGGLNNGAVTLSVFNNDLYAGGSFNMAGNNSANCIAKWNIPLEVESISFSNYSNVFPNPAIDKISIESNLTCNYFELRNVNGVLLKRNIISSKRFEIDLNNFQKGIYFLTVYQKDNQVHKKIIKE